MRYFAKTSCFANFCRLRLKWYVPVTIVLRQYTEALQIIKRVSGKTAAAENAACSRRLSITGLDSALPLHPAKQDAPGFFEAVAAHTEKYTKKTVAHFNPYSFSFYAGTLQTELQTIRRQASLAHELISDEFL